MLDSKKQNIWSLSGWALTLGFEMRKIFERDLYFECWVIRTSLSFYILILILFEVASRAKLNLYKNTIISDVLRSTAEQIEMIDLSNQTHLPRTNPTQIISLHSVHEIFMKYLYFQNSKLEKFSSRKLIFRL